MVLSRFLVGYVLCLQRTSAGVQDNYLTSYAFRGSLSALRHLALGFGCRGGLTAPKGLERFSPGFQPWEPLRQSKTEDEDELEDDYDFGTRPIGDGTRGGGSSKAKLRGSRTSSELMKPRTGMFDMIYCPGGA